MQQITIGFAEHKLQLISIEFTELKFFCYEFEEHKLQLISDITGEVNLDNDTFDYCTQEEHPCGKRNRTELYPYSGKCITGNV